MNKLKLFLPIAFMCVLFVTDALSQDCNYWYAEVGVKSANAKAGDKDKKNIQNIVEGIECLLKLEGDKTRGAFSGATHTRVSQMFPRATVEICALYYISYLFYEKYDHANGIALRYKNYEENRTINSDEAVKIAYESYRKWFEKVKEIGIEEARKQKLDPLECSGVRWY